MDIVCLGKGCERTKGAFPKGWRRGHCGRCYMRARAQGIMLPTRKKHWAEWLCAENIRVDTNGCEISCVSAVSAGYPKVSVGRYQHMRSLPALVLELKLGRPLKPGQQEVCRHMCHNRRCIRMDHLLPGTIADNSADMVLAGRQSKGEQRWNAKLTPHTVRMIRVLSAGGMTGAAIGRLFGVKKANVSGILKGRTWRHVSD